MRAVEKLKVKCWFYLKFKTFDLKSMVDVRKTRVKLGNVSVARLWTAQLSHWSANECHIVLMSAISPKFGLNIAEIGGPKEAVNLN